MTRSRLVDPAWSYPFFEALALKFFVGEIFFALASRPSLLRLRGVGEQEIHSSGS
jgi:hypothetical protein